MADDNQIEYETMAQAEKIGLASSDLHCTLIGKATKRLDIRMHNKGTITVRNTPIWIIREDMDEALLGEDVLIKLGIDVGKQLLMKGGVDIDYIEDARALESFPYLGGDCEMKIRNILCEKVEEVEAKSMIGFDKDKWLNLLISHMDEFRTIMSNDPPALVQAMKVIRLVEFINNCEL